MRIFIVMLGDTCSGSKPLKAYRTKEAARATFPKGEHRSGDIMVRNDIYHNICEVDLE